MSGKRKKILMKTKSRHDLWSNNEIKILNDLWLEDVPAKYIAQVLKRSSTAIEIKAMRIGLKSRRSEKKLVQKAVVKKARVRICLTCKVIFYSSHTGNRICSTCKDHPIWQSGNDLHLTFAENNLE